MFELVFIFYMMQANSYSYPVEVIKSEITVDYLFSTKSGCQVASRYAYETEPVQAHWKDLTTKFKVRHLEVDCRFKPSWAGRRHRNVGEGGE